MIETAEKARFKPEMKATITLGLVVLAYVLSWTPMCILSTLDMIKILTYDIHYYSTTNVKNMHLHRDSNPGPWNTVLML